MALITCPECGKRISSQASKCPNCGWPLKHIGNFSKAMIITGIMAFILAFLCLRQSNAVLYLSAIIETGDPGGLIGVIMALLLVFSGVFGICLRNTDTEAIPLLCFCICLVSSFLGTITNTIYTDLLIWSGIIFAFSLVYFMIGIYIRIKNTGKHQTSDDSTHEE